MARIFISYKQADRDKVFPLKARIESALGESCWIDKVGIESDAQFTNVIVKAILECEIVLFMYSHRHSLITDFENDWTIKELTFAKAKHKRVVFVTLDDTPLIDYLEFEFPSKQLVNSRNDGDMRHLEADLRRWLNIPEPVEPQQTPASQQAPAVVEKKEEPIQPQPAPAPQPAPTPTSPEEEEEPIRKNKSDYQKQEEHDAKVCGWVHVVMLAAAMLLMLYYAATYTAQMPVGWSVVMGLSLCASMYFACRSIREGEMLHQMWIMLLNFVTFTALANISTAFAHSPTAAGGDIIPTIHQWMGALGWYVEKSFWLSYIVLMLGVALLDVLIFFGVTFSIGFLEGFKELKETK